MHGRSALLTVAVAAAALALVACGDGNPASPSGTGNVVVRGVLLGEGAAFTSSSAGEASSNGGPITVMVEDTSISVTISGNGTFKLEDVPAGNFTLIFLQDGVEIGQIKIKAEDGGVVDIHVKIVDSEIVLIKIDFDDDDGDDDGVGSKVTVCHKRKNTLTIDASALSAHLGHGDTEGACSG